MKKNFPTFDFIRVHYVGTYSFYFFSVDLLAPSGVLLFSLPNFFVDSENSIFLWSGRKTASFVTAAIKNWKNVEKEMKLCILVDDLFDGFRESVCARVLNFVYNYLRCLVHVEGKIRWNIIGRNWSLDPFRGHSSHCFRGELALQITTVCPIFFFVIFFCFSRRFSE